MIWYDHCSYQLSVLLSVFLYVCNMLVCLYVLCLFICMFVCLCLSTKFIAHIIITVNLEVVEDPLGLLTPDLSLAPLFRRSLVSLGS